MDAWNPAQYERFKSERSRPFWDLAGLVEFAGVRRMLDIGCGTGELTGDLHTRQNLRYTLGIDSSEKMLAKAPAKPGLEFRVAKAEEFTPDEPFDVVISNAALQWTDGHPALFAKILTWLGPGGQLAVQMPANFDHPSHELANELGQSYGLKPRLAPVLPMERYAAMLFDRGIGDIEVFTKVYLHPMANPGEVVEWVKGTYLTHFEKQMEPARFQKFLKDYEVEFVRRTGSHAPYLYTFKRLFLYARI